MIKKLRVEDARSDIKSEWDAWEAEISSQQGDYDNQSAEYNKAARNMTYMIEDMIRKEIGSVPIELMINVQILTSRRTRDYCRVSIRNYFHGSDDVPFKWEWIGTLDFDGSLKKESNSYSGLQAVTPDQVSYLADCVITLEALTGVAWKSVMEYATKMFPKPEDYVTADSTRNGDTARKRADFQRRFKEATIQDMIGQHVVVRGKGIQFTNRLALTFRGHDDSYFAIVKATPKRYDVIEIPCRWVDDSDDGEDKWNIVTSRGRRYQVTKDKFFQAIGDNPELIEF